MIYRDIPRKHHMINLNTYFCIVCGIALWLPIVDLLVFYPTHIDWYWVVTYTFQWSYNVRKAQTVTSVHILIPCCVCPSQRIKPSFEDFCLTCEPHAHFSPLDLNSDENFCGTPPDDLSRGVWRGHGFIFTACQRSEASSEVNTWKSYIRSCQSNTNTLFLPI